MSLYPPSTPIGFTNRRNGRRVTRRRARQRHRQGVVLLLVVTLLVMFLLIGVTGVIVATTFHTSSKSAARMVRQEVRHEEFNDRVIMQLIRGTDPRSALWGHDLLGDLYGIDSISGTVQGTQQPATGRNPTDPQPPYDFQTAGSTTRGQVIDINVTFAVPATTYYLDPDHFVGRVFTLVDGPSQGVTSRIMQFEAVNQATLTDGTTLGNQVVYRLVIDARGGAFGTNLTGNRFVINGQPFNGTGVGYKTALSNGIRTGFQDAVPVYTVNQTQPVDHDQDGDLTDEGHSQIHTLLQPNFRNYINSATPAKLLPYLGGADEPWDAVDLNNMHISWTHTQVNSANAAQNIIPSFYRQQLIRYLRDVIFLDPTLDETPNGNDIQDQDTSTPFIDTPYSDLSLQQRAAFWNLFNRSVLRPHWNVHPNFTGSNPTWGFPQTWSVKQYLNQLAGDPVDPANGIVNTLQWDVDTDGDQTNDSIWLDPGLPVQTARDGRRYKILAAIQVRDLNANINVNTFGSIQSINNQLIPVDSSLSVILSASMPPGRGNGYGPAEITPVFTTASGVTPESQLIELRRLMVGDLTLGLPGRYGDIPGSGIPGATAPALTDNTNLIPLLKAPTPYTRTDLPGVAQIGFDLEGQPVYRFAASLAPESSPYAFDPLARNGKNDAPFTESELERILRRNDADGAINPGRLERLAGNIGIGDPLPAERRPLTTISTHIPVAGQLPSIDKRRVISAIPPNVFSATTVQLLLADPRTYIGAPATLNGNINGAPTMTGDPTAPALAWTGAGYASTIFTYMYTRSLGAQIEADTSNTIPIETKRDNAVTFAKTQMPILVPFELRHGYAMNVNRPFGNGVNDNAPLDQAIDNVYLNTTTMPWTPVYEDAGSRAFVDTNRPIDGMGQNSLADRFPNYGSVASDFLNNEALGANGQVRDPRVLYARNLYCTVAFALAQNNGQLFSAYPNGTATERQTKMLTRIAQWAINCAEFRDPDGIMTSFEFDLNPFDGWHVDGNLDTDAAALEPTRAVVWGCEQPELIISEAIAMHDRRVADTITDPSTRARSTMMGMEDLDLDQVKFPQGSLYLELYCPRPRMSSSAPGVNMMSFGAYPQDLYNNTTLALDRMAPAQPGFPSRQRPVWRIAISNMRQDRTLSPATVPVGATTEDRLPPSAHFDHTDPYMINADRDQITYQPESMYPTDPQFNIAVEREIWFTTDNPTTPVAMGGLGFTAAQAQSIFYNRSGNVSLVPGNYLVIGPRTITPIGTGSMQQIHFQHRSNFTGTPNDDLDPDDIEVKVTDTAGTKTGGALPPVGINVVSTDVGNVQPMETMVCASNLPTGWNANNERSLPVVLAADGSVLVKGVGLNVSMPLVESNPVYWDPLNEPNTPAEELCEPNAMGNAPTNVPQPRDTPLDEIDDSQLRLDNIFPRDGATPDNAAQTTGTYPKYKAAFLQRLANPLLPWNPQDKSDTNYNPTIPMNPYITVDWMEIDLTVFNGDEDQAARQAAWTGSEEWDPYDAEAPATGGIVMKFATRERGALSNPLPWSYQTTEPPDSANPAPGTGNFKHHLQHTLGFLNDQLGGATRGAVQPGDMNFSEFYGAPPRPFPWLAWYNRPFSSPGEVMLVPATSAGRLFHEYGDTFAQLSTPDNTVGPYNNAGMTLRSQIADYTGASGGTDHPFPSNGQYPFPHLLNFFQSSSGLNVALDMNDVRYSSYTTSGADLSRIFDLIGMPGPFMGTETWYQPNTFSGAPLAGSYRPPFNLLPNFREAGRLNLNTIGDFNDLNTNRPAWAALTANLPRSLNSLGPTTEVGSPLWDSFNLSRTGSGVTYSPEIINNPFRPSSAADLMPKLNIPRNGVAGDGNWVGPDGVTEPSDLSQLGSSGVSLLRADPSQQAKPLFRLDTASNVPANPATRLHGVNRLFNLTTNQANAFAVWVALGKFEVEYVGPTPQIPDGYTLGPELGFDDGTQQRYRSFFIIDRSIPVAYETGKNHNTSNTILLRRVLE